LKSRRATQLTLAERSGMGDTRNVLTSTGAADVVKDAGAQLVVLDEVEREAWAPMRGAHWPNGFHAARVLPTPRAWCRRCAARPRWGSWPRPARATATITCETSIAPSISGR